MVAEAVSSLDTPCFEPSTNLISWNNVVVRQLGKLRKQLNAGSLGGVLKILIKIDRLEALCVTLGADRARMNLSQG
jgi:hypothetical protein